MGAWLHLSSHPPPILPMPRVVTLALACFGLLPWARGHDHHCHRSSNRLWLAGARRVVVTVTFLWMPRIICLLPKIHFGRPKQSFGTRNTFSATKTHFWNQKKPPEAIASTQKRSKAKKIPPEANASTKKRSKSN